MSLAFEKTDLTVKLSMPVGQHGNRAYVDWQVGYAIDTSLSPAGIRLQLSPTEEMVKAFPKLTHYPQAVEVYRAPQGNLATDIPDNNASNRAEMENAFNAFIQSKYAYSMLDFTHSLYEQCLQNGLEANEAESQDIKWSAPQKAAKQNLFYFDGTPLSQFHITPGVTHSIKGELTVEFQHETGRARAATNYLYASPEQRVTTEYTDGKWIDSGTANALDILKPCLQPIARIFQQGIELSRENSKQASDQTFCSMTERLEQERQQKAFSRTFGI